jgi:hypothetical protein
MCAMYPGELECLGDETICGTSCRPCPRGSYATAASVTACTQCPMGTFSTGLGQTTPNVCHDCGPGRYITAGASACTECPPNSYSSEGGASVCNTCPTGKTTLTGVECSCGPGTAGAACAACPRGTFSDTNGSSACTPCDMYSYGPTEGLTSCTSCDLGTGTSAFLVHGGRYHGLQSQTGLSACLYCPAGTHGTELSYVSGKRYCTECLSGTYSSGLGATMCPGCAAGTFKERVLMESPSTACDLCPAGTYSILKSARTISYCNKNCLPGTYSNPGSSSCSLCGPGGYLTGTTACVGCAAGQYNSAYTQTACVACVEGTWSTPAATRCSSCSLAQTRGAVLTNMSYVMPDGICMGSCPMFTTMPDGHQGVTACRCLPGYVCRYTPRRITMRLSPAPTGAMIAAAANVSALQVALSPPAL